MSDISFSCVHCGQHLAADSECSGATINCPACSASITIPTAGLASATIPIQDTRSHVNQPKPPTEKTSLISALCVAFKIGCKQLFTKKLEVMDLQRAQLLLGKKAFEAKLFRDRHPEIYQKLETILAERSEMESRSKSTPLSLSEDLKRSVSRAGSKVVSKVLDSDLEKAFVSLGEIIVQQHPDTPEVSSDVKAIQAIDAKILRHNRDIAELSQHSSIFVRHPILLVFCIIISAALAWHLYGRYRDWRETRAIQTRIKKDMDNFAQELDAKNLEVQRMDLEAKRQIAEAKLREAQAKQEEAAEREMAAKKRADKTAVERDGDFALGLAQREARITEQQLEMYAATRFADTNTRLDPRNYVVTAAALGATTLAYKSIFTEETKRLADGKDWLELISFLNNKKYSAYPNQQEIDRAWASIRGNRRVSLFVNPTFMPPQGYTIYLVSFGPSYDTAFGYTANYERHPTGIGITFETNLSHTKSLLVVGPSDYEFRTSFFGSSQATYENTQKKLKKMLDLGEINAGAYNDSLRAAQERIYEHMVRLISEPRPVQVIQKRRK